MAASTRKWQVWFRGLLLLVVFLMAAAGGTAWHRWNAVPHEYQLFEAFLDDYKAEQI